MTLQYNLLIARVRGLMQGNQPDMILQLEGKTHAVDFKFTIGNFESIEAIKRYLYAGKAIITLVDHRKGSRFTYKISKPSRNSEAFGKISFFVGLLTSPDNNAGYSSCGFIRTQSPDPTLRFYNSKKMSSSAPSVILFKEFWEAVHDRKIPEGVEPLHAGICARCSRTLTHPDSIRTGIGPECAGKL